ncbi:MAG: WhiB family transcriptional regulator [Actinomycetota bacterium]|nr:WhiB family transcriptional regulator [Actinomycetota bacterium]MDA2972687.1 WhiB family transcriptional regulator [Actinomycetota bacterium]MDA3002051.1 WhiB family transcriptional regulator [Actinomycetota bacterium]
MTIITTDIQATVDDATFASVSPVAKPVARCGDGHGTLTALFFSDDIVDIARAKAICARCSLRGPCLTGALERLEPWGVWGGELVENGRIVADKRPRGRPAVLPRPTLVIDEDRTIRPITDLADKGEFEVAIRVA